MVKDPSTGVFYAAKASELLGSLAWGCLPLVNDAAGVLQTWEDKDACTHEGHGTRGLRTRGYLALNTVS